MESFLPCITTVIYKSPIMYYNCMFQLVVVLISAVSIFILGTNATDAKTSATTAKRIQQQVKYIAKTINTLINVCSYL